ncbi:helix-turn-helix domain-containing protein [Shimia sp.]|uniref:helix-turn-helix domain-containing protein n=1 Tax=Shimia sp. TaxID=1954381 RepID=UPI003BA86B3C
MKLIDFLTSSDLTLREHAREMGVSASYLSEIKDNLKEPGPKVARKIVKHTKGLVSLEELYGGRDEA